MLFDEFATELWAMRGLQPDEQVDVVVALLRNLDSVEVATAVHFLQGRFDQGYRPRLGADRSRFPQLSAQLRAACAELRTWSRIVGRAADFGGSQPSCARSMATNRGLAV